MSGFWQSWQVVLGLGLMGLWMGVLFSCQADDERSDGGSILPLTASGRVDTTRLPRMRLAWDTVHLGVLPPDTVVRVRIPVSNVGNQPLIIQRAWSPGACGCVVTSIPRDTIPSGAMVSLEVQVRTGDLPPGRFLRTVYVVSNAFPNVHRVVLTGVVDTTLPSGKIGELNPASVSLK